MKSKHLNKKPAEQGPVRWILCGLILITLYFQINLADPFNSPKMWILFIFAAWLTGYVVSFRKIIFLFKPVRNLFYLGITFIVSALFVTIFTDFHYTAFFGDTQRRNGFLSYLSLAIVMLASSIFFRFFNIKKLFLVTIFIGIVSVVYALMQSTGNDFVKWNNNYNSIIGTLGNPNFAASVMAIIGVISFSTLFISEFKIYEKVLGGLLTLLLVFAIIQSNARQGLLGFIFGAGIFLLIWLWQISKKLAIFGTLVGIIVLIFSILGMLQTGPLEKYLYKSSVSVRGYYWRAGIEMLLNHPIFGVGMDRYGFYFQQYREVNYPLAYGFEITSSNAHNTFIQLFATGGFSLGVAYLALNGFVFTRAVIGLKNLSGNSRLLLSGIFSSWMVFQAQSLISIDNIGISIWGWTLGGAIIGLSVISTTSTEQTTRFFETSKNSINLSRVLVSGSTTLVAFVLIIFLYQGEVNAFKSNSIYDLKNQESREIYKFINLKTIKTPLIDDSYALAASINLIRNGYVEEGLEAVNSIHIRDPKNLNALKILAITSEGKGEMSKAVTYREIIAQLNPWDAVNYLFLGKDYKTLGNTDKSKEMLDKILSFATGINGGPVAEQAKKDLT